LQELNHRFSEHAVELLILNSAHDPRVACESFRIDDICLLINNFYPQNFIDIEKEQLKIELHHYEYNVVKFSDFWALSNIYAMYQCWLAPKNQLSTNFYFYFSQVVVFMLTFSVSTVTQNKHFQS
jgi:hypothetical protein